MKTRIFRNKIVTATLLSAACAIALVAVASKTNLAHAGVNPEVIEISAKKYEFSPSQITLKKGEPVILRLTSTDRIHGFMSRALKVDSDIFPGKLTDIAVTPATVGNFTIICDHYCGTGHGNMKMKVAVVE
jgi:cytochrome c oxidase subunit 2